MVLRTLSSQALLSIPIGGWVHLDLEPSKEFYKLLARGFKPTSHAKIKLDRKNRRGYSTYPLRKRSRSISQRILLSLLMLMRTQ
jgi:hypothetical protein